MRGIPTGPTNADVDANTTYRNIGHVPLSEKGAANGVSTLDGGGKIPATQLPSSVMEYKGTWDASTNTPTLADGAGDNGDVYLVSVAGSQDLGSGSITVAQGDWVIYNGTVWETSLNSDAVVSVNSQTGVVVLDADDIDDSATAHKFATQTQLNDIASNTTHRTSDGSDHTFIDQSVTTTASPTFSRLMLTNGTIQRGGSLITGTNDLGLYSTIDGHWMRMVTNNSPIKFYSDYSTSGGIGGSPNFTIEANGDAVVASNLTAGSTSDSADRVIRVLSGDSNKAGFEAYGTSQGTGYLYVGQSAIYGGGIMYDGDGSPSTGSTTDHISFFRRDNGVDNEVFSYSYLDNNVSFQGDVSVANNLSKGSGSFKIDHPLPEMEDTHYLYHSFIEGPRADNIYRGVAKLENGQALINLDEVSNLTEGTFVALNKNIQSFTTNEQSWDMVRSKVEGNQLIIECQDPKATIEVSWLVIGERQDKTIMEAPWVDENGNNVLEQLKGGDA